MAYVKALQFFKFSLFSICFFILCVFIFKDFKRFMNNEDSASISFRKFNSSPKDKYPEITFCIVEGYGEKPIYSDTRLMKHNYNVSAYWDTITGKINVTTEDINRLPEFSNVTVPLDYWMLGKVDPDLIEFDSITSGVIKSGNQSFSYEDFYLSYQDSNQLCYSMTSEFQKNQLKVNDYIILNIASPRFPNGIKNLLNGILRVYVHLKGQTARNLGKEVFRNQIKLLRQQIISIHLSSFTVLRRRLDAKITCNPNLQEDDNMFRNYVIEKVRCIPPYWKLFYKNSTVLKSCDTQKQLKEAFSYNEDRKHYRVADQLDPPCSEITTTSNVAIHRNSRGVFMRFFYREDRYLEIANLPDFEVNSLWSSIGGFVGIFLGISVYHIAENGLEIVNKFIVAK